MKIGEQILEQANPVPVTVTAVPTGPEVGLSVMSGLRVVSDVLNSHSQLASTPFELTQSKEFPSSSLMLDNKDAT